MMKKSEAELKVLHEGAFRLLISRKRNALFSHKANFNIKLSQAILYSK